MADEEFRWIDLIPEITWEGLSSDDKDVCLEIQRKISRRRFIRNK